VETGPIGPLFKDPRHPYTRGLLQSVPRLSGDPDVALKSIPGQPPDLAALPPGCSFAPRCDFAKPTCELDQPALERIASQDTRSSACFETQNLPAESDQ
jgi:oligopeptide/dipeptide ABC transporter ATP-binding protein